MDDLHLYWGDLHTHLEEIDRGDEILSAARENVDFCAVLCYPFVWEERGGLRVESVRQRPEFLAWGQALEDLSRRHHAPGEFVTFPGYEWHGNRTRWGDHNVIYRREGYPLDDAWELPDLYANLRTREAIAIPHHTGYQPGWRGRDWSVFDPALSPVMEMVSIHGSSEGDLAPLPMVSNPSMGPRTSGGTFQDALARGHRLGVIGSNDYRGLPGRWGIGRAAVWARDLTREALWEAIHARRTYAATGDRIALRFRAAGQEMGGETVARGPVTAEVDVVGSSAIDRIEILHNGRVAATYCHSGAWERPAAARGRWKVRVEAGWGPAASYGFRPEDRHWHGRMEIEGGRVVGAEPCFTLLGQGVDALDARACAWHLTTAARTAPNPQGMTQGLILEVEGGPEARCHWQVEGERVSYTLAEMAAATHLVALLYESRRRVEEVSGLRAEDLENPDLYWHNAHKALIDRAVPEKGYRVAHAFGGLDLEPGANWFYARVTQANGQMAWSSPVWVTAGAGAAEEGS